MVCMVTLTTVILFHSVDEKLMKAVKSVSFSDEILLLSESEENKKIYVPRNLQAKTRVIAVPLERDFSRKRNIGLSQASSEWVLFIDSDEYVSQELKEEIIEGIDQRDVHGFFIKREDMFMGKALKHGEPSDVTLLRLARKDAGVWKRPVHEYWDVEKHTDILRSPLHHNPHASISSFLEKIMLYTSIESEYRKLEGRTFFLTELLFFPLLKFLDAYILKLGFLDGFPGLSIAYMMSLHSLCVRVQMYEKN